MRATDDDDRFEDRIRSRMESRSDLSDTIDLLSRRLAGAVMVAGALIGAGIYMSSGSEPQTYQAFASGGEVFRVNTDSGTIIACNAQRCMKVLERGQDLAEDQGNSLFKAPAAQLPAPAQPQALPAATQPAQPAGRPE